MAGDVILTPCATKGAGAVVFPCDVVVIFDGDGDDGDDDDDIDGTGVVSGDGTNICPYVLVALFADHTTENTIIIPTAKRRAILNANLNKVKILYTTNYKAEIFISFVWHKFATNNDDDEFPIY